MTEFPRVQARVIENARRWWREYHRGVEPTSAELADHLIGRGFLEAAETVLRAADES